MWSDAIVAIDPDGDAVSIRILESTPGFFPSTNANGLITGFEWQPEGAGQWSVDVVASDSEGHTTLEQIELVARYPRDDDLLLAMGDSVSAGFGRDRSDYLGPDNCWRSEQSAYPSLVFDQLVESGELSPTASYLMVSCSGTNAGEMLDRPVRATRRDGSTVPGERPQLDWAVEQNPTIITLTVGANDILTIDPSTIVVDDAGDDYTRAIDEPEMQARLDGVSTALGEILRTIVTSTDAHVALTTSYNPTAVVPVGVDGCGAVCFRLASTVVTERLNDVILELAARQPEGRVTVVRIDEVFAGHEATNGFGPDILRETNFGPFQDLVSQITRDTFPYCSDQDGNDETYVTRLDCVHPNDDGHRAIASAVAAELAER